MYKKSACILLRKFSVHFLRIWWQLIQSNIFCKFYWARRANRGGPAHHKHLFTRYFIYELTHNMPESSSDSWQWVNDHTMRTLRVHVREERNCRAEERHHPRRRYVIPAFCLTTVNHDSHLTVV